MRPTALSELLPSSLSRAGVTSKQLSAARVCDAFLEVLKGHPSFPEGSVRPISFKYHVLTVEVNGGPLASELQMRARRLIITANRLLGAELIERIRFCIR